MGASAAASACAASVIGIEGHLTYADATTADGPPGLRITGLPDATVRETRDRVYAAVANSGQAWPARKMTVTLQPASLPRHGTGFDLAIAIAVLIATGAVPAAALDGCVFTAELGLDGSLRPVRGVLPALLAARRAGSTRAARRRKAGFDKFQPMPYSSEDTRPAMHPPVAGVLAAATR